MSAGPRDRWGNEVRIAHPGQASSGAVRLIRRYVSPLVRALFRPALLGMEHLPRQGPFLLVANHSAGMGLAEILSFAVMYLEKVGPSRPLAGFVLPTDFRIWPLSAVARGVGAIPSTYEAAEHTLGAQVPILVFPGGDHESLRPIWHANRVDFGGRLGFLRIARSDRSAGNTRQPLHGAGAVPIEDPGEPSGPAAPAWHQALGYLAARGDRRGAACGLHAAAVAASRRVGVVLARDAPGLSALGTLDHPHADWRAHRSIGAILARGSRRVR